MAETVRLTGFRELHDALDQFKKSTERTVLRRVAIKALTPMMEEAKALVPVDEGWLRDSIVIGGKLTRRAKAQLGREPSRGVRVLMGTAARHAVPQEFGTYKAPAQPFMRPAWDKHQDGLLDSVKEQLAEEIERTAQRAARRAARKAR